MEVNANIIAKKYAVAFLNLYFDQMTNEFINKILKLKKILLINRLFYIYLRIPNISYFIKKKVLNKISQALDLDRPIKKMLFVLLDQGRIEILDIILHQIMIFYRKRKGIDFFKILSSSVLSDSEKKRVINFVENMSKKEIISDFIVDPKLICGLRIQSNTFLWERSIAKQLRDIKRFIFKQVGLC